MAQHQPQTPPPNPSQEPRFQRPLRRSALPASKRSESGCSTQVSHSTSLLLFVNKRRDSSCLLVALPIIVSMSPPGYPSAWLHPCRARFRFTWQSHCSSVFLTLENFGGKTSLAEAPLVAHSHSRLPILIQWVLAVLAFCELAWYALLSPDCFPGPLRVFGKVLVSLTKILINGVPGGLYGRVITVMNDCSSQSAKYRLEAHHS